MNPDLKNEFRHVRFLCDQSPVPPAFFIVTACNPEGKQVDDDANRKAAERLEEEVGRLGYESFAVTGGNKDFSHAEPGLGICCSRPVALDLARRFRQLAIFEVRNGRVSLISASGETSAEEDVGLWEDLLCPRGKSSG